MSDGSDPGDSDLLVKKQEFLESFFRKGAEFTQELLRENANLRRQLVQLESQLSHIRDQDASPETLHELVEKMHSLEEERKSLLARFAETEAEEGHFSERYIEIEQENSDLASLYVAQSQLHASLDVGEVVRVIIEIVLNFIGGNQLALLLGDNQGKFRVVAAEGFDGDVVPVVEPGQGVIGQVVASAKTHIGKEPARGGRLPERDEPAVCLPLRDGNTIVGAVAIWSFWVQKNGLLAVDQQMFELLASSGGRALEAARLATMGRGQGTASPGTFEEYTELLR